MSDEINENSTVKVNNTVEEESRQSFDRDDLIEKIKKYFDESELRNLERYYEKKDTDVNYLMYTFYDCSKEVESLKLQMPIIKPPESGKFIKKRDDDLYGGSSTMSRRSNSSTSSRSFGLGGFGKGKFGAQKVSINIGGGLDDDKLNSSVMRRGVKSIDPKLTSLKNDLTGTIKGVSKSHDTVFSAEKKPPLQNKNSKEAKELINKEKVAKLNETTKGIIEAAKIGLNKGIISQKKMAIGTSNTTTNIPTSESIDKDSANKNIKTLPNKPANVTIKQKTPLKKSEIITKIKSNSSSMNTAETEQPKTFKFEPKKKQPSGSAIPPSGNLKADGIFIILTIFS